MSCPGHTAVGRRGMSRVRKSSRPVSGAVDCSTARGCIADGIRISRSPSDSAAGAITLSKGQRLGAMKVQCSRSVERQ